MNPDKLKNSNSTESFRNNVILTAQHLEDEHGADHAIMLGAVDALELEGQYAAYRLQLEKAETLHLEMEQAFSLLINREAGSELSEAEIQLMDTIREKNKAYVEIKDEIVAVLEGLGYGLEEESTEETEVAESSPAELQATLEGPIEKLTRLYRAADPSVFIDYVVDGRVHRKNTEIIQAEILEVLHSVGIDGDKIKIFMNEHFRIIRSEIREKLRHQTQTRDRYEREVFGAELVNKYQELSDKVAAFMREEKVGVVEKSVETEENIDQAIEVALAEFDLFKQSGAYAADESFLQAEKAVERLVQHDEKDPVVAANDKQRYLRILTKALGNLAAVPVVLDAVVQTPEVPVLDTTREKVERTYPLVTLADVVEQDASVPARTELLPVVREGNSTEKYLNTVHSYVESKNNYKEADKKYKDKMRAYYADPSWRAKFRNGLDSAKKVFGINPVLPPALQEMKDESRRLRTLYATSLAHALKERGGRRENLGFDITDNQSKVAFGRKFILEPNQEQLKLQEGALPSETANRVKNILQTFSKYKWHTRVGTVVFAGGLGLASGGVGALLAGASYQAWKIAASTGMGAGAGLLTRNAMQGRTEAAREGVVTAEDRVSKKFSLANLEELETKLEQAQSLKNVRERQQKVATIAAAVAAGGLTGYGLSQFDGGSDVPTNEAGLSEEAVAQIVEQEVASEAVTPALPAETASVETPVAIDGLLIPEVRVPLYGLSGNLSYETILSDIKINGAFSKGVLPEADRLGLEKYITESTNDLLSAHPNISEAKLEAELLSRVQNKFASASWFNDAGITSIDVEQIIVQPVGASSAPLPLETSETNISGGTKVEVSIGDTESSYTEAVSNKPETISAVEKSGSIYVVQKGDTLSEITEKRFAEQLKDVPVEKRGVLLEQLFKNIEADSTLRDSIGMRSGDVDLIYANEKLNLDGVEAELSRLLERDQILESFRTSGPLSVEADADVKAVPITVVEKVVPVPAAVEAVPVVEKPVELVPPKAYTLNGQYAEHPEYKEYIQKAFGSMKSFEVAVEKSVQSFDNNTYDVFERPGFFGGASYESPYRFLGDMSLEQVREFEAQPNQEIRAFLSENNMKYDTYLAWLDQIDLMEQNLPNKPQTSVSDLFERYVAETQAPKVNPLIKTP